MLTYNPNLLATTDLGRGWRAQRRQQGTFTGPDAIQMCNKSKTKFTVTWPTSKRFRFVTRVEVLITCGVIRLGVGLTRAAAVVFFKLIFAISLCCNYRSWPRVASSAAAMWFISSLLFYGYVFCRNYRSWPKSVAEDFFFIRIIMTPVSPYWYLSFVAITDLGRGRRAQRRQHGTFTTPICSFVALEEYSITRVNPLGANPSNRGSPSGLTTG